MGQNSEQPVYPNVTKIIGAGVGISLAAVIIFLLLWFGLGQLGMGKLPRIMVSVCVPQLITGVAMIMFYLNRRDAQS